MHDSGSSQCVGGIFGDDEGEGLATIGDEFIKSWYSVFDYSNNVSTPNHSLAASDGVLISSVIQRVGFAAAT